MTKWILYAGAILALIALGSVVITVVGFIIGVVLSLGLLLLVVFTVLAGWKFVMTDYSDDAKSADSGSDTKTDTPS